MTDSDFLLAFYLFGAAVCAIFATIVILLRRKGYAPPTADRPLPAKSLESATMVCIGAYILLAAYRIPGGIGSVLLAIGSVVTLALSGYIAISSVVRLPDHSRGPKP